MRRFWLLLLQISVPGFGLCVEVHFENKDSGFFLKHTPRPWGGSAGAPPEAIPPPGAAATVGDVTVDSALLSVDRFTVLQTAQPAAVRATYGPFSTKQTVPARYSVPDPIEPAVDSRVGITTRTGVGRNLSATLHELQEAQLAATHRLDVSAHAVTREVARDAPVLRVLFHAGSETAAAAASAIGAGAGIPRRRPCVVLHATLGQQTLTAACAPDGAAAAAGGGACLAQLVLPASWWPPLPPPARDGKSAPPPPKQPPRVVKLTYSVIEPLSSSDSDGDACTPRVQVQPVWSLGGVWLVGARAAYRSWRAAGPSGAVLLLPRAPLYPRARLHLPLVVRHSPNRPVTDITVKIRVKSGMRLFSATASSDKWSVTAEVKTRSATITATRREQPEPEMITNELAEEVLTLLAEVSGEGSERGGGEGHGSTSAGRLVWSVRYGNPINIRADGDVEVTDATETAPLKATARFDIEKDDIQTVVPISKNWEVLNTAVLTGRQVSQAMKVLIVSQAGQIADVTLQSSCHSEDESVLKVSSSCSSVYVDGSEIRGSSNASVIVKYGTYTGLAKFTVWMPEFPLEVNVDDFRLSQIKGWKIPDDHIIVTKMRRKRSYDHLNWAAGSHSSEDMTNSLISDKQSCRIRFQQSPVEVYARFLATDHDSGRVSYFVSRRTWLKVTDLVLSLLRVSDPRIASLHGKILQGRSTGRTEVQVLSPITGRVIGAREIRVGSDKVSVSRIIVRVISGLQLNISPDSAIENGFISETTVTRRLTAQYQEGLLDIDIEFSDGTRTPLRDVAASDYYLMVESLDPEIVAFAPMVASHHPRVIAVGEGNGELLRVNLLVSEECRSGMMRRMPVGKIDPRVTIAPASKGGPLASALASVDVDFSASEIPQRPDTPQNDGIMARGGMKGPLSDLRDILIGIPLKDENNHEPTVQARQHNSLLRNTPAKSHKHSPHMTPVEIGMYVLLAAFCFAIVVFVVSCVVYASKFKPNQEGLAAIGPSMPMQSLNGENGKIQVAGLVGTTLGFAREKATGESTTNAHDWVWLGRATIDRHSSHVTNSSANRNMMQNNNNNNQEQPNNCGVRITDNPLNLNYADPDDAIQSAEIVSLLNNNQKSTSFCQSESRAVIDTTTYCKRPSRQTKQGRGSQSNSNAPPLPPHGLPLEGKPMTIKDNCEEYKPPVPPHRNVTGSSNGGLTPHRILADTIMPPTRRHSRQHRKDRIDLRNINGNNGNLPDNVQSVGGDRINRQLINEMMHHNNRTFNSLTANTQQQKPNPYNLVDNLIREDCTGMFEFDNDLPVAIDNSVSRDIVMSKKDLKTRDKNMAILYSPDSMKDSGIGIGDVQFRNKLNHSNADHFTPSAEFVQPAENIRNSMASRSSPEVKQATIVGNPMYKNHSKDKTNPDDLPTESLGLDDLEMDYDQILHYFHNLKESNA